MDQRVAARTFGEGLLLGLGLPVVVSVLSDGWELFEPVGLTAALAVALLSLCGWVSRTWRTFAVGALVGAALYYPVALIWASGHGMSMGG